MYTKDVLSQNNEHVDYFAGTYSVYDSSNVKAKPIGILSYQSWVGDGGIGTGNQFLQLDDGSVFYLATLNYIVNGQINRPSTTATITAGAGITNDLWYGIATFTNLQKGVLLMKISYTTLIKSQPDILTQSMQSLITDRKLIVSKVFNSMRLGEQKARVLQTNEQFSVTLYQGTIAPGVSSNLTFGTGAYTLGKLIKTIIRTMTNEIIMFR